MAKIVRSLLLLTLLVTSSFSTLTAQPCSTHQFPNHKTFAACKDLPVLNSTIYWNYFPSNGTVDLAFRATLLGDAGWVTWAINPNSKGMVGSQALVAFQRIDGSMAAYTSPIKSYGTRLEQGNLTFPIYTMSAVQENKEITIFASLGLSNNGTTVNQLWQQGPLHGNTPGMHSMSGPYLNSYGTLDFLSGKVEATSTHHSLMSPLKISHGIINSVSWGIVIPVGVIVARNFKGFGPIWFKAHRSIQIFGSLGAGAGIISGFVLGSMSPGIVYKQHKCIGITLLVLIIVQLLVASFLRPKPDGKYRWLWSLFHYAIGYPSIILANVNVFIGFGILEPPKSWLYAYVGIFAVVVFSGLAGAAFTCWNNKRTQSAKIQLEQRADGTA
ncbi:cytochrome b561 and DOMON domain-containing protein At4g17280-like [Argentina anserina]|uniref:cytochrome b561 and DOMON domain-containing protein At4g17280-like n=1 Tax=Argentina anserina TaxID=57926 RepID=UPI0021768C31|nr:cytochrome b561 and DOMON domain-containing protein At4g17280-like [Potentilla anserina]